MPAGGRTHWRLRRRSADRAVEILRADEAIASDSGEICKVGRWIWGAPAISGETREVGGWRRKE